MLYIEKKKKRNHQLSINFQPKRFIDLVFSPRPKPGILDPLLEFIRLFAIGGK